MTEIIAYIVGSIGGGIGILAGIITSVLIRNHLIKKGKFEYYE